MVVNLKPLLGKAFPDYIFLKPLLGCTHYSILFEATLSSLDTILVR